MLNVDNDESHDHSLLEGYTNSSSSAIDPVATHTTATPNPGMVNAYGDDEEIGMQPMEISPATQQGTLL